MNSVSLMGRMTKEPEIRETSTGTKVLRFTLAVNRQKKEDGADFISCVAFNKTAEIIAKYSGKGLMLGVNGHIQTGSYDRDGQTVYTTDVIVDRTDIIEWKREENTQVNAQTEFEGFELTPGEVPF